MSTFSDLKLIPSLQQTLSEKGFARSTPIQARAIPLLLGGKSVVATAQTGTGKTLAYVLPVLHQLKGLESAGDPIKNPNSPRAAVIVPTRELAEQVSRVFKIFTHQTRLRVRSVVGGTTMEVAKKNMLGAFEVVVATPARLLQLMERKLVDLSDVRVLIFDEADQMLDPSFLENAKTIAQACRSEVQLGMFSATLSTNVQALISELFVSAEFIETKGAKKFSPTLNVRKHFIKNGYRFPFLKEELKKPTTGGTLVFVNTREQCDEVAKQMKEAGLECRVYRGEMDKQERRLNLKDFRAQKIKVLVSTDLGSRGLDVDHVSRVINYHLPRTLDNYIHRVGRTARAGRKGLVVNLVTQRDQRLMEMVEQAKQ